MGYRDRLRVWESDYGRSEGWDLELDGRVVARMDEPRFEDMFWMSYRVTPVTDDPALAERVLTEAFWKGGEPLDLVYRRATGLVAEHPVPSTRPLVGPSRVNMRGLYVDIRDPRPWESLVLLVRRLLHRSRQRRSATTAGGRRVCF